MARDNVGAIANSGAGDTAASPLKPTRGLDALVAVMHPQHPTVADLEGLAVVLVAALLTGINAALVAAEVVGVDGHRSILHRRFDVGGSDALLRFAREPHASPVVGVVAPSLRIPALR